MAPPPPEGDLCPACFDRCVGGLRPDLMALAEKSQREDREVLAYVVDDGMGGLSVKNVAWGQGASIPAASVSMPKLRPGETVSFLFHTHPREVHYKFSAADLSDPGLPVLLFVPETGRFRMVAWSGRGEHPSGLASREAALLRRHHMGKATRAEWDAFVEQVNRRVETDYVELCGGRIAPIPSPAGATER